MQKVQKNAVRQYKTQLAAEAIHGLVGETLINGYKFRRLHESLPLNIRYRKHRKRSGRTGVM